MPGTKCRRCDAEIHFAQTAKGKAMPLDATPSPTLQGQGVQVVFEGVGGSAQCRPYDVAVEEIAERRGWSIQHTRDFVEANCEAFVSHFSTCPAAGEFRRGGRR